MTSDADAFRAAIIDSPEDDAPRLAYSDWLEEHDFPELASFIRESVRVYRADPEGDMDRAMFIGLSGGGREEHRIYAIGKLWYEANRDWVKSHVREVVRGKESWGWGWRRGFVEELCMPADDAVNELKELRKRFPIRRVVVTRQVSEETQRLLNSHVKVRDIQGNNFLSVVRNNIGVIGDFGEHGDPLWQYQLKLLFRGVEFDFSSLPPDRTTMQDPRWQRPGVELPITYADFRFTVRDMLRAERGRPLVLEPRQIVHGTS